MIATFLDLRKHPRRILDALDRREEITILYRGKVKAVMNPADQTAKPAKANKAFGMWADREDMQDVETHVRNLRKGRYDI